MKRSNSIATRQIKGVADLVIKGSVKSSFIYRCLVVLLGTVISTWGVETYAQDNTTKHLTQAEVNSMQMRFDYWLNLGNGNKSYMKDYVATLDSLDIAINIPASFSLMSEKEIERPFFFSPNPEFETKYFHCVNGWSVMGPILESAAKDALFVYPILIEFESPIHKMESELIVANQNDDLDITPMITHITGKEAQEFSKVDEIILYDFDMSKPILGKYNHVTGIILRKKGHYPMGLKIIMDDEGMKKRDEYVRLLLDNVRYGDTSLPECIEKEQKEQLNSGPIKFPLRKIKCIHDL